MTRYVRILLLTTVVLALGAATASAAPYQDASLPVAKRVADLLSRMTLEEKVGQMTQTERSGSTRTRRGSPTCGSARSCPAAARRRPPNTPEAWADMVDRFQRAALDDAAAASRCSTASTPCTATATCSARRSSRTTSASAPRATRRSSREIGAHHRRGDARDRPAVDVRAVHLRRARRPLGPHLRELQRGRRPRDRAWRPRSTASRAAAASSTTATACSPPPSTTRATATPSTAPPTGDYKIDQGVAITSRGGLLAQLAAPVRPGRAASTTSAA